MGRLKDLEGEGRQHAIDSVMEVDVVAGVRMTAAGKQDCEPMAGAH